MGSQRDRDAVNVPDARNTIQNARSFCRSVFERYHNWQFGNCVVHSFARYPFVGLSLDRSQEATMLAVVSQAQVPNF